MAGVRGAGGPVPKRSDQRRRANKPAVPVTEAVAGSVSDQPPGDPNWHPIAARWYRSLADSGQSQFYEASDWALAYSVAESMSRDFKPVQVLVGDELVELHKPIPGASLAAWLRAMTVLLATEGDRRRLSLELKRAEVKEATADGVSNLDAYRRRLSG